MGKAFVQVWSEVCYRSLLLFCIVLNGLAGACDRHRIIHQENFNKERMQP